MEQETSNENNQDLYRFEYVDPDNSQTYVEWVWLALEEVSLYKPDYPSVKYREATEDEVSLYEEAYSDGYGVAAMMEFEDSYDGVTFRVELGEDGELDMHGTKMFECAICGIHKDFEEEVGVAGGLYLGEVKDDKLWHVCYDCAQNAAMLKNIEESMEES